ncbi:SusD/RagB family nutrient-binding outer membrane lipoprotein [Flammeovirga pectinis]|nr:SusD/RagB family nutrient-binding outer membrane lipoprotein [Flammeovirga pectinis]
MNKNIYKLIVVFLSVLTFSCTQKFDEMNTDPVEPTEIPPSMAIGNLLVNGNIAEWSRYQQAYTLYTSLYSQYFANTTNYFNSGRYIMNLGWVDYGFFRTQYWESTRMYDDIKAYSEKYPDFDNHYWIARIQYELSSARTSDQIGDMPYTEGGRGIDYPKYDSQEFIYNSVLTGLDSAYVMLGKFTDQPTYGGEDVIYNGDLQKWRQLANSLLLRYAIRVSKVDPALGRKWGTVALSRDLINSNADNATVATDPHSFMRGHPLYEIAWWNEFRMSKTMQDYFTSTSTAVTDPRMYLYFDKVQREDVNAEELEGYKKLNQEGKLVDFTYSELKSGVYSISFYKGVENGLPAEAIPAMGNNPSDNSNIGPMFNNNSRYMIMSYAEVSFLKSEAALLGWGGNSEAAYLEGIRASWEYVATLSETQSFLSSIDPSKVDMEAYIKGLPTFSGHELENIQQQKWIANFPDGCEGWAEYRRTGYPTLNKVVKDDSGVDLGDGFIKKLPYTESEITINAKNALDPSNNQGQGEGIHVRVWWDID